tara:strand:+ start:35 stop:316 length:282 start_codon:yes stop_codon:yes gene_type:complete
MQRKKWFSRHCQVMETFIITDTSPSFSPLGRRRHPNGRHGLRRGEKWVGNEEEENMVFFCWKGESNRIVKSHGKLIEIHKNNEFEQKNQKRQE